MWSEWKLACVERVERIWLDDSVCGVSGNDLVVR